jgi:hypothetical protein
MGFNSNWFDSADLSNIDFSSIGGGNGGILDSGLSNYGNMGSWSDNSGLLNTDNFNSADMLKFGDNQESGGSDWLSMDSFLGGTDANGNKTSGWGMNLAGIGMSLYKGWLANKQLQLAKESLAFQKDAYEKNFNEQQRLIERDWADKMASRAGSK